MAFFGLVSRNEHKKALEEIDALKQRVENLPDWLGQTAEAQKWTPPDLSRFETQAKLYQNLSWVSEAIEVFGNTLPGAEFSVARIVANKEPKDIPNHPFEMLLQRPNPVDSRSEFLFGTGADYKLNGNAYWYLNRENIADQYAPPDEIWTIPPHMIVPVPDEKSYIRGYLYYPGDGAELFLHPWEIVHFRRYNPFNRFVGLSAMEAISLQAAGGAGMLRWNARLFEENNGRLPGMILFEQMIADPTWKQIKADTNEAAKKREFLMLRGVGNGGVKWLSNSLSQKEMEFLAGLEASKKEVQDAICPGLYTWLSGDSTYSNAGANRAAFNELSLYPAHVMIGEKVTNEILPLYSSERGRPLIGRFEDVRISDKQQKLSEQQEYAKTHTLAEIREKYYGDEPLGDERDTLLPSQVKAESAPTELQPVSVLSETMPQDNAPMPDEMIEDDTGMEETRQAVDELDRLERKALKNIGKRFSFEVRYIPAEIKAMVFSDLNACRDDVSIKALFERARKQIKPRAMSGAALHLEGLKLAIQHAAQSKR